ncbi:hypothetical protein Tco_1057771 [Tanacetum coccineum]|uniref:Uncharacterized protein n=1 Tax=Tanacetum coccineum TaxID=301880 RepID=A0ABQ5H7Q2_9ASTR
MDHDDLEQLDEFDLEEMDLKWQVAMISMRLKKFHKKSGRKIQFDAKEPIGFDKTNTAHAEDEEDNFALMAFSNSGSDTESSELTSDFDTCESNSSVETLESMPKPVVNEPNVVNQPKVWSDAPIIKEYESDIDDDCVSTPLKEQEQPSFTFVSTDKHVKTPRETVKEQHTYSQRSKVDRKDYNGLMSGFGIWVY